MLLIDELNETFAMEAKNLSLHAGNLVKSSFTDMQGHGKTKRGKKPFYLQRHCVKHSLFTRNLFEMQIVLQVEPPSSFTRLPTNYSALPFFNSLLLLKISSCNFRSNQPSPFALIPALSLQVVTFIIGDSAPVASTF